VAIYGPDDEEGSDEEKMLGSARSRGSKFILAVLANGIEILIGGGEDGWARNRILCNIPCL
jgi:hypothetical protein